MKTLNCYSPGPRFPSVSVTGIRCSLNCPHCMGVPLAKMLPAETPSALLALAARLSDDGALGFLLSGGCGDDGVVPLETFSEAISSIKTATDLKINAHVGYPRPGAIEKLVEAGIDVFSVTFPMSDEIGKRYFGVDCSISRYEETVSGLLDLGAKVIPHALIGLGDQTDEVAGLRSLASYGPKSLVVIVFTPLRRTPLSSSPSPSDLRIIETIVSARSAMNRTSLTLGCMRPRGRIEMEARLMQESLDGIVMPSSAALKKVAGKVSLEQYDGCCAIHL